jgi:hypothetical protein
MRHSWAMTPPQYPYFPPPQYQATPALGRVRAPHSTIDIVITAIMSALAALAGLGALYYSLLFPMATDACETPALDAALDQAYLLVLGGIAIAVMMAAGMIIAAVRGWVMWIWPTLALGLIVITLVIGVHTISSASCTG